MKTTLTEFIENDPQKLLFCQLNYKIQQKGRLHIPVTSLSRMMMEMSLHLSVFEISILNFELK